MRIDRVWALLLALSFAVPTTYLATAGDVGGMIDAGVERPTDPGSLEIVEDDVMVTRLNRAVSGQVGTAIATSGLRFSPEPTVGYGSSEVQEIIATFGVTPAFTALGPTRAADAEGERSFYDFPNGSRLSTPTDSVSGTLQYDQTGASSDWIDWYKFSLPDIDPAPGASNGVHNVTFDLDAFQDAAGGYTPYEYALTPVNETTYTLSEDYADIIDVQILYYDPNNGGTYLGGWSFFYDDMDDTDGWSWRENWTVDFVTPVPSTGEEDDDGFANGLTEVGWYYIGITFNWYVKSGAPERGSFDIGYDLTVDTSRRQSTDQGANDIDVSERIASGEEHRAFSRYNNVDWYTIEGNDPGKLWNMTFNITRTGAVLLYPDPPYYYDPWLHVLVVMSKPGPDGIWDTEDDGLYVDLDIVFSAYLGGSSGNVLFINSAEQYITANLKNDWTVPDKRAVFFGFYSEPRTIYDNGADPFSYSYPNWFALSDYMIEFDIVEESLNRQPSISLLQFRSDWELDREGGNYDTEFTFDVIYQDPDDDPPLGIFLRIDPDTPQQKEFPMVGHEADPGDVTYTNGKAYRIALTGEQITKGVKDIAVHCVDEVPEWSLRKPMSSKVRYLNDTLEVWDDDPVGVDPLWPGVPEIMEDDPAISVPLLEYSGFGPFTDPEGAIDSIWLWDTSKMDWTTSMVGELGAYEVVETSAFALRITPGENVHGHEEITVRAYDEHSWVNLTTSVEVNSVNDIPVITQLEAGSNTYSVLQRNERLYEADMTDDWAVKEDQAFSFTIVPDDNDLEETSGSFSFEYIQYKSDDWTSPPEVDGDGVVTILAGNADLRNEEMFFSISDGMDEVELLVIVDVANTADAPVLTLPSIQTAFAQYDRIDITPSASDIDPGDELSFAVNMEVSLGDEYPAVIDQLPEMVLDDLDWSMDARTGRFWFQLDDQGIWGTGPDRDRAVSIVLAFKVQDLFGEHDIRSVEITLNDLNDAPQAPMMIQSSRYEDDTDASTEYTVEKYRFHLWADPALDPDGDTLRYIWDMGDGTQLEGLHVNHTYSSAGTWNVRLVVDDGEDQSDTLQAQIATVDEILPRPKPPKDPEFPVGIAIGIALLLGAAIVGAAMFFVLRKKKEPQTDPSTQPAVEGHQKARTRASVNSCPSCGTEVEPSWFICPGCHGPLQ